MKRGAIVCIIMLVAMLGVMGCSSQPNTASSSGASSAATESSSAQNTPLVSDSILVFDGNEASAKLVADMEAGTIPVECTALYDQEGSLPAVTVTDAQAISDIYSRLAQVTVVEPTMESVTDCYHAVEFVLQDGTRVGFNFEDDDLLVRGGNRYKLAGSGPLWAYVRTLQAGITGGRSVYAINMTDEAGVVVDYPLSAEEFAWVKVVCSTETYKDINVTVNGKEVEKTEEIYTSVGGSEEKTPANKRAFEFSMPDSDAEVVVTVNQSAS